MIMTPMGEKIRSRESLFRCPVRLSAEHFSIDSLTNSLSNLASAPYREMISSPA